MFEIVWAPEAVVEGRIPFVWGAVVAADIVAGCKVVLMEGEESRGLLSAIRSRGQVARWLSKQVA